MRIMLEGLVTTLLSLDYHGEKIISASPKQVHNQKQQQQLPSTSHKRSSTVPSRCRSNSLSSYSSSDGESSSNSSNSSVDSERGGESAESSTPQDQQSTSAAITTTALSCVYHSPPTSGGVNYESNDTVFGSILRGELPARVLAESSTLLAFWDIKPRAPLHALIIPKAFVGSVFDLTAKDVPLLMEMQRIGEDLVVQQQQQQQQQLSSQNDKIINKDDLRLCFHIPPFHSVDHLHLHVLAPVRDMGAYYKYVKYNPRTRWCITLDQVIARLQKGQSAVPYRRPVCCKEQREEYTLYENIDHEQSVTGTDEQQEDNAEQLTEAAE